MRDITYYRDRLRIDKNRMDDEMSQHSERLEEIGRGVAAAAKREALAKRELEQTEARLIAEMHEADPKVAINRAQIEVKRHREYTQAHDRLLDLREELGQWESLEKAWYGRGFDLRALGELWARQYLSTSSSSDYARPVVDRSDYIKRQDTRARRTALTDES